MRVYLLLFTCPLRNYYIFVQFLALNMQQGYGYTPEELLILTRSYMSVSDDPTVGTNQKASAFWTSVHLQYNKNVARANKNCEDDPTWRVLPSDRPKGFLKSQWYTCLCRWICIDSPLDSCTPTKLVTVSRRNSILTCKRTSFRLATQSLYLYLNLMRGLVQRRRDAGPEG